MSLYCFKFNDITGEITRIEITNYNTRYNSYTGKCTYTWGTPRINKCDSKFSVSEDKLDRFVSNKVFTFKDDYEYVCGIIENTLLSDAEKLDAQLKRKQALFGLYMKAKSKKSLEERNLL